MNCPNCGADNAPGSKFCLACGTAMDPTPAEEILQDAAPVTQDQPVPQEEPAPASEGSKFDVNAITTQLAATVKPIFDKIKPIFSNKKILAGIIGGAAILVVLAIVFSILGSGNGFIQAKQYINFAKSDDDVYSVVVDNKVLSDTIDCEGSLDDVAYSIDGKVAAVLTGEGELYVVNGKKLKQAAEDVISFELSVNGDYVVYASRGEKDESTSLHLCKVSNVKSTEITDELAGNYEISPDGKSVAYFAEGKDSNELMLFKGKKSVDITDAEGASLKGLSNGGKYIYVTLDDDGDTFLYVYNAKGDREKLESYSGDLHFNDDHTQVMFANDEGKTYVSTKGKEANKVSSDYLDLLIPSTSYDDFADGCTYPVSNLYDHVYTAGDKIMIIKKNSDKNIKLISDASLVSLDASAKYVYFIHDSEELCVAKISDGDKVSDRYTVLYDESVYYTVTSDRKLVYFADEDTLYSVNGKKGGKAREITDELESFIALNAKDVAYYIADGDLYACTNGKKGTKVLSDILALDQSPNGVVYAISDDTAYATSGSKKLKKILELN